MKPPAPPRLAWAMWKRFLAGGVIVIFLTAAATATAGLLQVKSLVTDLGPRSLSVGRDVITPAEAGQPQTILILGSDRRFVDIKQKNPSRSDTILLVRLDPGQPATTLLSIPRDLKVRIQLPRGGSVTDKINSAYARGGPRLTAQTIKRLLHVQINHIVNVNFAGFREAVDYLGCVYTDIDRRYFNDNAGAAYGQGYATINIQAGYQRLCGAAALDYVRFRHTDTDLVRAARQQGFLRDAKDQVGTAKLVDDRNALARIFGRATQTDRGLHSLTQVLRLLRLVAFSAGHPIHQVHFEAQLGQSYVTATSTQIRRVVHEFLNPPQPRPPVRHHGRRPRRRHPPVDVFAGLIDATGSGQAEAAAIAGRAGMPVYYPRLLAPSAGYEDPPRAYVIRDERGRRHRAYRLVVRDADGGLGQYYGIQGTTWQHPPILADARRRRRIGHRTFELYYDGRHLRLVAWRTHRAVYWVANTLLETIQNRELLGIAASLSRAPSRG